MTAVNSISRSAPSSRGQTTRLTRRGRTVVVLVALVVALIAFSLGRLTSPASAGGSPVPVAVAPLVYAGETPEKPRAATALRPSRTVVRANETLWQVARRVTPSDDPRVVVEDLMRRNHLPGSSVRAGQVLLVAGPTSLNDTPGAREDTPGDLHG